MKIPLNRIVTFAGPYISILAGGVAAWLIAKLNVLGIPGLDEKNLATWIAAGLTAILTSGLSHLGQMKWLKGHHIELEAETWAAAKANAPVDDEPGDVP